jgi:hypothetical protein
LNKEHAAAAAAPAAAAAADGAGAADTAADGNEATSGAGSGEDGNEASAGDQLADGDGSGASRTMSFAQIVEEDEQDSEDATDALLGVINYVARQDAALADDLATTVLNASSPQDMHEVVFTELADGRMEESVREGRGRAGDSAMDAMDVEGEGEGKGEGEGEGERRCRAQEQGPQAHAYALMCAPSSPVTEERAVIHQPAHPTGAAISRHTAVVALAQLVRWLRE